MTSRALVAVYFASLIAAVLFRTLIDLLTRRGFPK